MLSPVDALEIYAFLHHFVKRAKISEMLHHRVDFGDDEIDFGVCGETTNAEANGRMRHIFLSAERSKDVRRFERCRRACTATRQSHFLHRHQHGFAFDVGEAQIEASRIANGRAVSSDVICCSLDAIFQAP